MSYEDIESVYLSTSAHELSNEVSELGIDAIEGRSFKFEILEVQSEETGRDSSKKSKALLNDSIFPYFTIAVLLISQDVNIQLLLGPFHKQLISVFSKRTWTSVFSKVLANGTQSE